MRDELLARGWFQNLDPKSPVFDLRLTSVHWDSVVNWSELKPHQIMNIHEDDTHLTDKFGLTRTLRNSQRLTGVASETFYPRAFCLSDPSERMGFMAEFRLSKAEAVLDAFLRDVTTGVEETFSEEVVEAALDLCETCTQLSGEEMAKAERMNSIEIGSASSWALVHSADLYAPSRRSEVTKDSATLQARVENGYRRKWNLKVGGADVATGSTSRASAAPALSSPPASPPPPPSRATAKPLVERVKKALKVRQANRKGEPPIRGQNTWILKPTHRARGEGIEVLQDVGQILKRACRDAFRWIAQKYVERPQLVHGFKFDIRQWVLVTRWKPLTVFIWKQPFLRFAGQKYDENLSDMSKFVHLTNNSLIKGTDEFKEEHEELKTKGFMWYRQQYEEWLHDKFCRRKHHFTPWLTAPPYKSWEEGHSMECGSSEASSTTVGGSSCDGSTSSAATAATASSAPAGPGAAAATAAAASASSAPGDGAAGARRSAGAASPAGSGSRCASPRGTGAGAASPRQGSPRPARRAQDQQQGRRSFADAVADAIAATASGDTPHATSAESAPEVPSVEVDDFFTHDDASPTPGAAAKDGVDSATLESMAAASTATSPDAEPELQGATAETLEGCPASGAPPPATPSEPVSAEESKKPRKRSSSQHQGPCVNIWDTTIAPQIKEVVRNTLQCAAEKFKARKNTYCVYGFDLMVSHEEKGRPKVWLLEVNKRPCMSYSTPLKYALVRKMYKDLATVVLDLPQNPDADIGEWELLC